MGSSAKNGNFPAYMPHFDGKYWDRWRVQIRALFGFQEVLEIIEKGFEDLGANPIEEQRLNFKENKKKDCKAIFILHQCLDTANFDKKNYARSAKEAWDILFYYVVCAIEESKDISALSFEELQGTLEARELRMDERSGGNYGNHALVAYANKKGDQKRKWKKNKFKKPEDKSESSSKGGNLSGKSKGKSRNFDKKKLVDIDTSRRSKIRFVDHRNLEVEGAGNMVIKRRNGKTLMIENVLYVPRMKSNLMSIGQLIQKGFQVIMKNDALEMYDGQKKMILKAPLSKNKTFVINIQASNIQCLKATSSIDENCLWHSRFGHLNFKSLSQLGVKKMVTGIPMIGVPEKVYTKYMILSEARWWSVGMSRLLNMKAGTGNRSKLPTANTGTGSKQSAVQTNGNRD
ncbi:uncharacterized protein [Cicer arietinum]|uniref:uncharacterized protein n=1 Tax=Cicer arietinum TaxID=3827 RepID=UPI003CC670C0